MNKEAYKLLDDEMKYSPIAYPSAEKLKNAQVFTNLPEDIDELQKDLWTEVRADSTGSAWSIAFVILAFALLWAAIAFYNRVWKKKKFK